MSPADAAAERISGGQYRPAWWWIIFGQLLALVALGWALTATVGAWQVEALELREVSLGDTPREKVLRLNYYPMSDDLAQPIVADTWYYVLTSAPLPFVVQVHCGASTGGGGRRRAGGHGRRKYYLWLPAWLIEISNDIDWLT